MRLKGEGESPEQAELAHNLLYSGGKFLKDSLLVASPFLVHDSLM